MKGHLLKERTSLLKEDSARIAGGFWEPFITTWLAIKAVELGDKIINWLTTEH